MLTINFAILPQGKWGRKSISSEIKLRIGRPSGLFNHFVCPQENKSIVWENLQWKGSWDQTCHLSVRVSLSLKVSSKTYKYLHCPSYCINWKNLTFKMSCNSHINFPKDCKYSSDSSHWYSVYHTFELHLYSQNIPQFALL